MEVAVKWGLDLRAHRSHQVTRAQVEGADLVLTMERAHVRDVALMSESSWPRTFTLPEAIRRAEELGPRAPDESLPVWVGRLHGGRQSADLLLERKSDEVDDPYMCGQERYEAMCSELDQLTDELLELVWPQASAVDSENADLPGEEREDEDQAGWRRKLRLATGKRRAGA